MGDETPAQDNPPPPAEELSQRILAAIGRLADSQRMGVAILLLLTAVVVAAAFLFSTLVEGSSAPKAFGFSALTVAVAVGSTLLAGLIAATLRDVVRRSGRGLESQIERATAELTSVQKALSSAASEHAGAHNAKLDTSLETMRRQHAELSRSFAMSTEIEKLDDLPLSELLRTATTLKVVGRYGTPSITDAWVGALTEFHRRSGTQTTYYWPDPVALGPFVSWLVQSQPSLPHDPAAINARGEKLLDRLTDTRLFCQQQAKDRQGSVKCRSLGAEAPTFFAFLIDDDVAAISLYPPYYESVHQWPFVIYHRTRHQAFVAQVASHFRTLETIAERLEGTPEA